MSPRPRALLSWSSGKDSAYALAVLRAAGEVDVVGLVTTLNAGAGRVAMHEVREELLDLQAGAVGLPLWKVALPWPCSNEAYEAAMMPVIERALGSGITVMAFGDLFLADIRDYREGRLAGTGISPLFPLWGRDTAALARQMTAAGVRAVLTCVDPDRLGAEYAGQSFDAGLLDRLPVDCDPCGENGEFHTFVWDGPGFARPVPVTVGEVSQHGGLVFADLRPS